MKILLTTIKTENRYTEYALKSLYSILANSPLEVSLETYDESSESLDVFGNIIKGQYNIVYFHFDEYNEDKIVTIAEMIKKAVPSIAILAGGMQVSVETKPWMRENPWIDYVIRGEGELVLYNFLKSIISREFNFENIEGLAYRLGDTIHVNDLGKSPDLEDLPFVYEYSSVDENLILYETMRGNSDKNIYDAFYDSNYNKPLSIARACRELKYFSVMAPRKVVILDKVFNFNSERSYRLFEHIINNDNGVTSYEFNISGENLDDGIIRLLSGAREGLFIFNIEIPSTNKDILTDLGRNDNIYQLMYNVTKLMQIGNITCKISIIAGLPNENINKFKSSFNNVYGLADGSPLTIKIQRLRKGSKLRQLADRMGYEYSSHSPYDIISTDAILANEMIKLRQVAKVVQAYIGDGGFRTSIPAMMTDTSLSPYEFFDTLATYIYVNDFDNDIDTKESQAEHLMCFADSIYERVDGSKLEIVKSAIRTDARVEAPMEQISLFEKDGWNIER